MKLNAQVDCLRELLAENTFLSFIVSHELL